jgi:nicotinate-nucleotide pyrophosphorylase (carboxylating)
MTTSLSPATLALLEPTGLAPSYVEDLARRALTEDLCTTPSGALDTEAPTAGVDVTSVATIPAEARGEALLVARAAGVIAGLGVAAAVFDVASDGAVAFTPLGEDATTVVRGTALARVEGPARALLSAERSALNLLCRASGIATHTFLWASELAGTGARVLDTRKTTPGLRALEKYAVRAGGGLNKRFGLHDVAMIKDNHIVAAGSITAAYKAIRERFPETPIQVEVESLAQAHEAVAAGAYYLLADNQSPAQLREIVAAMPEGVELEATGGLTLERAREYGETGVDYLSVGGLSHSSPIVDIALDLLT